MLICDASPAYNSTRLCLDWRDGLGAETYTAHRHALSAAADAGLDEPFVAIAIDGVGYGTDGMAWGGEALSVEEALTA